MQSIAADHGSLLNTLAAECQPPCANGGHCVIPGHCSCPGNWTGARCEEGIIDECQNISAVTVFNLQLCVIHRVLMEEHAQI